MGADAVTTGLPTPLRLLMDEVERSMFGASPGRGMRDVRATCRVKLFDLLRTVARQQVGQPMALPPKLPRRI
jgi:hypothetical protein